MLDLELTESHSSPRVTSYNTVKIKPKLILKQCIKIRQVSLIHFLHYATDQNKTIDNNNKSKYT